MAKTSQRAVATEKSQEWTITDSGVELTRFQEALANWAVAGSPSTLLRHERDSESEFDNFQIATIQSRDGLIFGYASYLKFDAGSLEDVLDADETGSFNAYTDKEGRHVPLSEIQHFDVFDEYTGRGGIIYINKIEVMTPRVGLGKMLLQHLTKCEESELLFLHSIEDAAPFFIEFGFEFTGIRNGDYNPELVLALRKTGRSSW